MEPDTLETVIKGLKMGGVVLVASAGMLAAVLGSAIGIYNILERKYLRDELMKDYEKGEIDWKPTIFNIYRNTSDK